MALSFLAQTRNAPRDTVMFLLSVRAGLRAKEIAGVTWMMVLCSDGLVSDILELQDRVAKMRSGRTIPLSNDLRAALLALHAQQNPNPNDLIIQTERRSHTSPSTVTQWFFHLYRKLGFVGASSHSGRRTFITNASRKIGLVGGSMRDVQIMSGHKNLNTTSGYIDVDPDASRKVVNLI